MDMPLTESRNDPIQNLYGSANGTVEDPLEEANQEEEDGHEHDDDEDDDEYDEDSDGEGGDDDEGYGGEEDGQIDGHFSTESAEERMEREEREKAEELAEWKEQKLAVIENEIKKAAANEKQLDKDDFLATYGDALDHIMQESPNKTNVLHMLARNAFKSPSQFPGWIIDYLHHNTIKDPHGKTSDSLSKLLADKAQTNPSLALAFAIRWDNEPFIQAILSIEMQQGDESLRDSLRNNLREPVDGPRNCIHWSIENLPSKLTVQLIERATGDECLLARDGGGYTPLHLAVEYPKCLGRLEVIKALLKHGERALDQRCKEGLSVYRYYQKTKADYRAKIQKEASRKAAEPSKTKSLPGRTGSHLKQAKEKQQTIREDWREKEKRNDVAKPLLDDKDKSRNGMRNGFTADVELRNQGESEEPIKPLQRTLTGSQEISTVPKAAVPANKRRSSAKKLTNGKKVAMSSKSAKEKERVEEEIEDEIKLQYFRSTFKLPKADRDVKSANEFLYAQGKGPSFLEQHVFTTVYGPKEFDQTLHHVAVDRIILKQTKNKEAGRTDMEIIFKLLKDKGVRHIVKVIVFDSEMPPHSDESIERCLLGFKSIEILDWRKVDLCPETILKACPKVVELHLWWSGNNAILIAWSAPGGLAKLPRLREIHLHQTKTGLISNGEAQCIESAERDKQNLQRFKERIQRDRIAQRPKEYGPEERKTLPLSGQSSTVTVLDMWPDITVDESDTNNAVHGRSTVSHGQQPSQTAARYRRRRHDWLDVMDKFAAGIDLIDMERTHPPDIFGEDVRVALIDDGVEITNKKLTDRIYNGWTCDTGYEGDGLEGIPRPYTSSETQHGTFMASTICRICPRAKIFVFRLDVVSTPGERAHFTAKSAADALELAIDPSRKFDIISMSWTIVKNETNAHDIERLDRALRKADDRKSLLLFCASPDNGEMADAKAETFYPFGCENVNSLFKMAAATVDGNRVSMAGSRFDYSLPGHEVEDSSQGIGEIAREALQKNRQASETEHSGLKTGSSIATALGAGLAALIIYCVRLGAAYTHRVDRSSGNPVNADADAGVLGRKSLELIKQPKHMREVFKRMLNKSSSSDRYVEVYDYFGILANELKTLGQQIEELKDRIQNEMLEGTAEREMAEKELQQKNDERMAKITKLATRFVST
ncbi:hypothetical protein BBK36DRAFT_20935 [Trichoderma citrinoviride]|uniref:Peptidase S8/S53 domain-containing protein n=1 Tax=Trichoderma citrinoviride TaxID=58853 RepID=A0A2T4B7D1_9HYPO|nr:hypothetical protein BBK36DRAFT_20935 [Trichoderma citrinoviride]PTB65121.1 hypothetical protein BBK36DRAFT_20935 [Trichoderma citrinoviride]